MRSPEPTLCLAIAHNDKGSGVKNIDNDLHDVIRFERIISEAEAAQLIDVSLPSMRRHRYAGDGPPWVQLSERRIGYRIRDLIRWVDSRTVTTSSRDVRDAAP